MTYPILTAEEAREVAEQTRQMTADAVAEAERAFGLTLESFMRMHNAPRKAKQAASEQANQPITGDRR